MSEMVRIPGVIISKEVAINAVCDLTTGSRDFRAAAWSEYDAERLERAAAMIRRQLADARVKKAGGRADPTPSRTKPPWEA
jgi:hypothetical protein